MALDDVSLEILRRKLDDARFLAMWVANETALFLADLGDEGANAERLAAFVRMVRGLRSYGSRRLGGGGGDLRRV